MRLELATTLLSLAISSSGLALAGETARLSPARIGPGQASTLRIDSDDGTAPTPPSVDGLHFRAVGQSTQVSIVDGAVSRHAIVDYEVVADRPGSYAFAVGGRTLSLEVDASAARGAPSTRAPAAPSDARDDSLAFLRVTLPAHKVYVGQSVPITFKAYFRAGTEVTLTAIPSLGIPAFTVGQMPADPRQTVETVDGVPYRVATWTAEASAAMPGRYQTSSVLPIVARYREAPRPVLRDPFGGLLDDADPFGASGLQSFFGSTGFGADPFGRVRERELTLRAHAQDIEVLPLPTEGRPAGFSGAVGSFDIRAHLAASTASTFEPLTLTVDVTGHGSFDRVTVAGVAPSADWKAYPPTAGALAGGTKTFDQVLVPLTAGAVEVPTLSLSFFDPDRAAYVTRTTAPIPVRVARVEGAVASSPVVPATPSPAALRPDHVDDGASVSPIPPYRRAWFWLAFVAPLLALAVARALRTDRSARDGRAARRAEDARREEMRRTALAEDVTRYLELAHADVRHRLALAWHVPIDDVTAAEVAARVGPEDAPLVDVLRTAEDLLYAGVAPRIPSLFLYDQVLERQLARWEARS